MNIHWNCSSCEWGSRKMHAILANLLAEQEKEKTELRDIKREIMNLKANDSALTTRVSQLEISNEKLVKLLEDKMMANEQQVERMTKQSAPLQSAHARETVTDAWALKQGLAELDEVLSGCGVYDGTELHEASACLVHLSRRGVQVEMFAPDIDQMHVINHTKGEPSENEKRNVLVESARIARGNISALSSLVSNDFDAVLFPGGFGAAKNLSDFAVNGANMSVNKEVDGILKAFHQAKKPIGLCCIAPVLAAKSLTGCQVTVGSDQEEEGRWPFAGTAGAIQEMGSTHIKTNVTEVHVDQENKIVTTPAFMCNTAVHEVFDGIGAMVNGVLALTE